MVKGFSPYKDEAISAGNCYIILD